MTKKITKLQELSGKTILDIENNDNGLLLKFIDDSYALIIPTVHETVMLSRHDDKDNIDYDKESFTIL